MDWKQIALKCSWVQFIENDAKYAELAFSLFAPILHQDILHCNFKSSDVDFICPPQTPLFWKDFLCAWSKYNYRRDKKWNEQLIWFNSDVRLSHRPFIFTQAYRKGLKFCSQLWNSDTWKTAQHVEQEFSLSLLQYNSIKSAIPSKWLKFCSSTTGNPVLIQAKCTKKLSSKVYAYLQESEAIIQKTFNKWSDKLLNVQPMVYVL